MITTKRLVTTSVTSHDYHFFAQVIPCPGTCQEQPFGAKRDLYSSFGQTTPFGVCSDPLQFPIQGLSTFQILHKSHMNDGY